MSDQEIIAGILTGKDHQVNQTFGYLYQTYYRFAEQFLVKLGAKESDVPDIFQNSLLVFLDMVETGKFRQEASVKTFLFAICKNLWWKERGRRKTDFLDLGEWEELPLSSVEEMNLDRHLLSKLLENLDAACEKLLTDFYFRGLTYDEIAAESGRLSRESVKVKKSRCLKKLIGLITSKNLGFDSFTMED